MRYIIVDGYNVIRADPRLQSLERISLERAREVLVQTLASSPRLANDHILAVFDGRFGPRSHVHSHRLGRVDTVFSGHDQTADEVIVAQARSLVSRAPVVVVSNDMEVQDRCRAAGCAVSGSENLLRQMPGRRPQTADDAENDCNPTLSTIKRGNPRRASKRARQQREIRF